MILIGDVRDKLKELDDCSVQCCVTSPPYWGLRDYGNSDQIGLEETPEEYIENMVAIFNEVRRVLKDDGVCWLNLGDTYSAQRWTKKGLDYTEAQPMNGMKDDWRAIAPTKLSGLPDKNLVGIPWRVALALQKDGWYLRQDIIWNKPNPMPESVQDRCTKSHEYIFLLTKSANYYYDAEAIRQPNANKRSVWTITTKPFKDAHFAVFPIEIPVYCIKAGSKEGDIVLDPFMGSGTTALAAQEHGRKWVGVELNPEYVKIIKKRTSQTVLF